MDTEMLGEETAMAQEVLSQPETLEESPEPENSPAANGEGEQMAVNGHDAELIHFTLTELPIVMESVPLIEEVIDLDVVASPAAEHLDTEPGPEAAAPETDESSDNCPELVADDEPEPEMEAESVPVAQLQQLTLEDQVTTPERAEAEPPSLQEETQQVETVEVPVEAETKGTSEEKVEDASGTEPAVEKATKSAESATPKEDEATPAVVESASPKKPTEPAAVKEEESMSAEVAAIAQVEEKKEPEVPAVAVEAPAAAAEAPKEEDTAPASGSLSFTILEQKQTKDALLASRTLVALRGLPGSGKSFLARAIADAYKDQCTIICADEHGVKPESPEASVNGYKAMDEAVVARCGTGAASSLLLVVDDTNHTQDRLARLSELAEQHHLVAIFLEPRTEWCSNVAQLCEKSKRGLQEAQLKTMKSQLEEMSLPLYFGWFLLHSAQEKVRCTAMDFLKTLDTLEAFKKHIAECECFVIYVFVIK